MAEVTNHHRIYVLAFGVEDNTQVSIIRGWLRDTPEIATAMSPIPLVFYFKTHLTAPAIRDKMDFLFPNGNFIVSEISAFNSDGRMPPEVWRWFMSNNDGNSHEIKPSRLGNALLPWIAQGKP